MDDVANDDGWLDRDGLLELGVAVRLDLEATQLRGRRELAGLQARQGRQTYELLPPGRAIGPLMSPCPEVARLGCRVVQLELDDDLVKGVEVVPRRRLWVELGKVEHRVHGARDLERELNTQLGLADELLRRREARRAVVDEVLVGEHLVERPDDSTAAL